MKNFTYTQTLAISIVFTAGGYLLLSHHIGIGSFIAVVGDVGIIFSVVMLIKAHKKPKG